MATKIRLARHGKKASAFYHVVVADSRAPRDGRFIEKIGTYNPNTNPATIELNFERALYWIGVGAQPTDTTRALLSYRGVMMMHHLNGGVLKGALTQEQATAKFEKWIEAKQAQVEAKRTSLKAASTKTKAEQMAAETKAKEAKATIVAAKLAQAAQAAAAQNQEAAQEVEQAIEAAEETMEMVETAAAEVEAAEVAAE